MFYEALQILPFRISQSEKKKRSLLSQFLNKNDIYDFSTFINMFIWNFILIIIYTLKIHFPMFSETFSKIRTLIHFIYMPLSDIFFC